MDNKWELDKLSIDYLFQSGLLGEINRTILNLVGFSMKVEGNLLKLQDVRNEPYTSVYTKEELKQEKEKLQKFMSEFGYKQLEKRRKKLGYATQP